LEPPALYRCVVDGAQPGGTQPLQMLCVTTIAKEGGHASCSVTRRTVIECDGRVKHVAWTASDLSALQPRRDTPVQSTPPPEDPATANGSTPPKTLAEAAKQANEKTAEQFKKSGDTIKQATDSVVGTIGTATGKTWRCLTSLFTRCGE
jgi:hypothetical protein